jgi:Ca2+-binding RTX toxin-like protein
LNAVIVDSTAPHVQSVYSNDPAATYHVGQTVTVNVLFDDTVAVDTTAGAPILLLETGDIDRYATYIGTVGGNTLQFTYTVHTGDFSADLDFTAANSLFLHGATIRDVAGNNAVLKLPAPGDVGSLASSHLGIDGIDDVLAGTPGADRLNGGVGADTMTGGDGNDIYYVDNSGDVVVETNADTLTGGMDTVISTASSYTMAANVERAVIATNSAADITGNGLDNLITAGGGDNVIDGGAGIDTVSYASAGSGVFADLAYVGALTTGGSGSDTLISIENLTGSAFDDVLNGDGGANALSGGAGLDEIYGGGGNDLLTGGTGADEFVFDIASGKDKIRDFSVSEGDVIQLVNNINGSGIVDSASAFAHVHDVSGNAVLDLGGGNTVVLLGVHTADLSAASFYVFP